MHTKKNKMIFLLTDKLAALWPFLGIVAEVIVLCIIIFIYEKKRSREMEDEADGGDDVV
jgi:flagellar biosynthesis/type III secretory pathway M-ring protein FliF/YscJ